MTEATTRIYVVKVREHQPRLVRASHPVAALQHVVRNLTEVRRATQEDLVTLLPQGTVVESAGEQPQMNLPEV